MFRSLTRPQLAADIIVAALCVLFRATLPLDNNVAWLVLLAMGGALAIRRLSPGLALGIAWLGAVIQMAGLMPPDASNLAILAVLYATARYGTPRVKWLGLASAILGAIVATTYFVLTGYIAYFDGTANNSIVDALPQIVFAGTFTLGASLAALGLSWTAGLLAKTWREARESRAREAAAEAAIFVEQERNRIARDMHDVVAHSLAVVIAQADGARYARESDPSAVDGALTTIATTARGALADVRLLLGQLRDGQSSGPEPVLGDLDALVTQLRASGLDVSVSRRGDVSALPTNLQLAVFRIAQEALTNALRHGDAAATATLTLVRSDSDVELSVSNRLSAGASGRFVPGHGITGMRERALLVGGSLTSEIEGDRFVVRASMPLQESEPA